MAGTERDLQLRCRNCGWREICGPAEMARRLRAAGKLRPGHQPELGILYELFRTAAPQWNCPECGKTALAAGEVSENHGWPGPVPCRSCGKPIPRERLEALPNATLCAECQRAGEAGRPAERREFCPRCGAPLEIRVVERGGRTRYVLSCSGNPPCAL